MNRIQFERTCGNEFWEITDSSLSIIKVNQKYRVNLWAESYYKLLEGLEDSGDTATAIEFVFTVNEYPNLESLSYKMPDYSAKKDSWGETDEFYSNWYYHDHRDVENAIIEVNKLSEIDFKVLISGTGEDPISSNEYGETKIRMEFTTRIEKELRGFWAQ